MPRHLTRRQWLTASTSATILSTTGLLGRFPETAKAAESYIGFNPLLFVSPTVERFVDALHIPPRQSAGGHLRARNARHRFHREFDICDTLAFGNESYLGPTLEAFTDQPVQQTFHNEIVNHPLAHHMDTTVHGTAELDRTRPRVTIHLHGGITEPASDGHPLAAYRSGGRWVHNFSGRQAAMGLWYHDHAMGITRLNVYAGLAGNYWVRDRWDTGKDNNPLGLPAGDFELPLVIQDKIFTKDGGLGFRSATLIPEGSWEGGQVGDVPVINGVAYPRCQVARGLYRFRLLNASNLRTYLLSFSNGMKFWQVGTDAGLLNSPVPLTELRLAAGERADILVDFSTLSPGTQVKLRNTAPLPLQFLITLGDVPIKDLLRFDVGSAPGPYRHVPTRLRGAKGLPPPLPPAPLYTRVRTMTALQLPDLSRFPPAIMSMNNLGFSSDGVEEVRCGDVERWDIVNTTTDAHPIHVHMATMRPLSRRCYSAPLYLATSPIPPKGTRWAPSANRFAFGPELAPEPWENGLKDTIEAPPGQITRILVQWPTLDELGFDPDATYTVPTTVEAGAPAHVEHGSSASSDPMPARLSNSVQPQADQVRGYVWHCHVLDHEDHDMMLPFRLKGA